MGAICCQGNQIPIQSAQKPYAAFPIDLNMLYMKFDQNGPTDFREYYFEKVDKRRTIAIFKYLTRAFSSGELIIIITNIVHFRPYTIIVTVHNNQDSIKSTLLYT